MQFEIDISLIQINKLSLYGGLPPFVLICKEMICSSKSFANPMVIHWNLPARTVFTMVKAFFYLPAYKGVI